MRRAGSVIGIVALVVLTLCLVLVAFRLPLLDSLRLLAEGAFGNKVGIGRTLARATPLLLCGLGILIAWRAKMFNIGGESQFIVGGLAGACLFKLVPTMNPPLLNLAILFGGLVGGALLAVAAAWMQIRRGVQLVISTILLNFIVLQLLDWAVASPLKEKSGQLPLTDKLPEAAMMMRFDRQTDLHTGVFVALAAAAALFLFLTFTSAGFRLKVVGANPRVARANGIPVERTQYLAMAISGGLCGLAGAVEYTALVGQIGTGFSQNWGFIAIPVALVGLLHPFGVVLSAIYFGALFAGTENLARFTSGGSTIVYVIQGVAVLSLVGAAAWRERKLRLQGAGS